jgi:Hydantoinase/oxoprolinase N-terminal region
MTVQSSCWIGIDTGGTFTDVVLADRASGSYWFRKVPSNPADPAEAILRGLDEILAEAGIGGERVEFVGLGTTLATNAVLEGKTGRVVMLTTSAQGFAGGEDGLCGAFLLSPGTDAERKLPSAAVDLPLRQGDLLRVLTPGGGVHY